MPLTSPNPNQSRDDVGPALQVVDVKGLAEALQVSERTVYDLVRSSAIPYMKVGRLLRFDIAKVMAHLTVAPDFQMEIANDRPKKKPAPVLYIKPMRQEYTHYRRGTRNPWSAYDDFGNLIKSDTDEDGDE